MKKTILSIKDVALLVDVLTSKIAAHATCPKIYGVPRGGISVAYALADQLGATVVGSPEEATIIVDDIIDSGATRARYSGSGLQFFALIDKTAPDQTVFKDAWVVFPWEVSDTGDDVSADDIGTRLLQYLGEDVAREGLRDTPTRYLKALKEMTSGYTIETKDMLTKFADGAEGYDGMVVETNIPVYSLCEHHIVPFFGVAHIAYLPGTHIVGLSKIVRMVDVFARRLQVQERLTKQIADALDALRPEGIAVMLECRHICMEARGIRKAGVETTTTALRGAFKKNMDTRNEFYDIVKLNKAAR